MSKDTYSFLLETTAVQEQVVHSLILHLYLPHRGSAMEISVLCWCFLKWPCFAIQPTTFLILHRINLVRSNLIFIEGARCVSWSFSILKSPTSSYTLSGLWCTQPFSWRSHRTVLVLWTSLSTSQPLIPTDPSMYWHPTKYNIVAAIKLW